MHIVHVHAYTCVHVLGKTYMALGLGLVSILSHDLLEGDFETQDLGHDVNTAHDDLVEMPIPHQVR